MVFEYRFNEEKHIHQLNGKNLYGCTTVLKILSKDLTYWAVAMGLRELGWSDINDKITRKKVDVSIRQPIASKRFEEVKKLTNEDYLKLLDKAYKAHAEFAKQKAEEGTDAHQLCEDYIKSIIYHKEPVEHEQIRSFIEWSKKNVKQFLLSESHGFHEGLWTGCIVDLAYIDVNDKVVIGDFKNRDKVYFSDFVQCGGCDLMITRNGMFDKNGVKIGNFPVKKPDYYAVFPLKNFTEPVIVKDVDKFRRNFVSAVRLFKSKEGFESEY